MEYSPVWGKTFRRTARDGEHCQHCEKMFRHEAYAVRLTIDAFFLSTLCLPCYAKLAGRYDRKR